MGGLFRAPKPMVIDAPSAPAQEATINQAQAPATAAADAAARDARAEALARARRGLAGTIATSPRGVLAPLPGFATRKTLLGE
jgi:hypothetical protein